MCEECIHMGFIRVRWVPPRVQRYTGYWNFSMPCNMTLSFLENHDTPSRRLLPCQRKCGSSRWIGQTCLLTNVLLNNGGQTKSFDTVDHFHFCFQWFRHELFCVELFWRQSKSTMKTSWTLPTSDCIDVKYIQRCSMKRLIIYLQKGWW